MAIESTNGWSIKNYRSIPYYEEPYTVLSLPPSEIPDAQLNIVRFDLYDGSTMKTTVTYFEPNDISAEQADILKWSEVAKAKNDYLMEKYQ